MMCRKSILSSYKFMSKPLYYQNIHNNSNNEMHSATLVYQHNQSSHDSSLMTFYTKYVNSLTVTLTSLFKCLYIILTILWAILTLGLFTSNGRKKVYFTLHKIYSLLTINPTKLKRFKLIDAFGILPKFNKCDQNLSCLSVDATNNIENKIVFEKKESVFNDKDAIIPLLSNNDKLLSKQCSKKNQKAKKHKINPFSKHVSEYFCLSPLSFHMLTLVKRKVLILDLDETLIHSYHENNIVWRTALLSHQQQKAHQATMIQTLRDCFITTWMSINTKMNSSFGDLNASRILKGPTNVRSLTYPISVLPVGTKTPIAQTKLSLFDTLSLWSRLGSLFMLYEIYLSHYEKLIVDQLNVKKHADNLDKEYVVNYIPQLVFISLDCIKTLFHLPAYNNYFDHNNIINHKKNDDKCNTIPMTEKTSKNNKNQGFTLGQFFTQTCIVCGLRSFALVLLITYHLPKCFIAYVSICLFYTLYITLCYVCYSLGVSLLLCQSLISFISMYMYNWMKAINYRHQNIFLNNIGLIANNKTLGTNVLPGVKDADFILKLAIDRHPVRFFVYKRPHVDKFLSIVSQWYDLVIYTASLQIYGSNVADSLERSVKAYVNNTCLLQQETDMSLETVNVVDPNTIGKDFTKLTNSESLFPRRFFRQHCTCESDFSFSKDIAKVEPDLSRVCILDNSPSAYKQHYPHNGIHICSWFNDPKDTALLDLLPFLDALRFVKDVRSVLARNIHSIPPFVVSNANSVTVSPTSHTNSTLFPNKTFLPQNFVTQQPTTTKTSFCNPTTIATNCSLMSVARIKQQPVLQNQTTLPPKLVNIKLTTPFDMSAKPSTLPTSSLHPKSCVLSPSPSINIINNKRNPLPLMENTVSTPNDKNNHMIQAYD